jgi:hypothetical protein
MLTNIAGPISYHGFIYFHIKFSLVSRKENIFF